MRFSHYTLLPLLLLWGVVSAASAAPLNRAQIQDEYREGNFETVSQLLEAFRSKNSLYSSEDSVFIAKYLGVVYAAHPATREKGRYFMYQMLELNPRANLLDMFVSEEIDRIFEKVRAEHALVSNRGDGKDPRGPSEAKTQPTTKRSSQAVYWVVGGTAVAVGIATYWFFSRDPGETHTIN